MISKQAATIQGASNGGAAAALKVFLSLVSGVSHLLTRAVFLCMLRSKSQYLFISQAEKANGLENTAGRVVPEHAFSHSGYFPVIYRNLCT